MPPHSSLTSSFSITDSNNEVVCPLRNQDGSSCRKRCIGEKRYRSMQEHIRRAHPENYISKLPATEESFLLMINTPPQDHGSTDQPSSSSSAAQNLHDRRNHLGDGSSNPGTPRHAEEYTTTNGISLLGAASAAVALAELHGVKSERYNDTDRDYCSDTGSETGRRVPRTSIELPPLQLSHKHVTSDPYSAAKPREPLPSLLANSPPGRSSTLPPLQRPLGPRRPRKQSVTKRGRESSHKKKTAADWLRHIQNDERLRPGAACHDRKAVSAEPSDYGKRWKDLIDAADKAASAAGDVDQDRTPVPQSPVSVHRGSLPPLQQQQQHVQHGSYQASPLQQALTPPSPNPDGADPFPSVESGDNFNMAPRGLDDSSPTYPSAPIIHIYCAACQGVSELKSSYACTECICGLCSACVEVLMAEHGARRKCPRCATIGGRFKPFQLEVR
ncbi:hypothetical protein G6O67_006970 [Ophiocordyceps sinensis]|uniref:RING zinc finger-like domain-containing protein n=1 Tax=Ophiocordyceps sinensis TaxID=72228 RepID=A0A8H4LU49_9HYPO|nr:hypothetical protein G6O67_006970 [Ophiocordyceps sinensis]